MVRARPRRGPPRRPRSCPARGGPRHDGAGLHPGRGRDRQDPGDLAPGRATPSRPAPWRRTMPSSSRSPTRPPARCASAWPMLGRPGIAAATFHSAALRQLRHFWPRVSGRELPGDHGLEGRRRRRPGPEPAGRLPLRRGARPGGRDRMGEGPSDPTRGLRAGGRVGRPRRSPPRPPVRAALPAVRGGQGAGRPDRLRGHARADGPADRGRRVGRPRGPRPLPLVQRR